MKTLFYLSLIFLFLCSQSFSQYLSEPAEWVNTLSYAEWEIELEDINNDGQADLVSGNNYYLGNDGRVVYSLNTGGGVFSETWNIVSSNEGLVNALTKGYLRNSNDRDFVASYSYLQTEVIHNINNTLSVVQNNMPSGSENALGRVNNDIYDDLAILNTSGTDIKIFRNLQNGIFYTTPIQTISTTLYCPYIKISNLDKTDFYYDLVYLESNGLSSSIKIRKNSNGTFGNPTTINLPASSNYEVDVEDVNYDDYPDLITIANNGVLKVFLNNGAGSIHTTADLSIQTSISTLDGDIEVGDINNDGWKDIVVSNYEGFTYIFINNKTAPLFNSSTSQSLYGIAPYENMYDLELSDIHNTGGLSALLAISNSVAVFYPNGDPAPAPPKNLTVTKDGNNHPYLSWRANTELDFSYYEIWKKGGNEGGNWHLKTTTTNTFYTDTYETVVSGPPGANQGLAYYYIKAADDEDNKSVPSNEVNIRVNLDPPEKLSYGKTNDGLPVEFSILQNYPNPFNPTTQITYALAEDAKVQIKIYDMLGTEIAELVNANKPAGFYETTFDASDLSSGVYIYRIIALNGDRILFTQSKQMMLVK